MKKRFVNQALILAKSVETSIRDWLGHKIGQSKGLIVPHETITCQLQLEKCKTFNYTFYISYW